MFGFRKERDWWYGEAGGAVGWFPATYCEEALDITLPISKAKNPGHVASPPPVVLNKAGMEGKRERGGGKILVYGT